MAGDEILRVEDLHVTFSGRGGDVHAVNGVNLTVRRGEILGIVGESGSGKSVTSAAIMGVLPPAPACRVHGKVLFEGVDLLSSSERAMQSIRGRQISMILQDPLSALNPVMKTGDQIAEVFRIHHGLSGRSLMDAVINALKRVRFPSPERGAASWPHQLSGGMRQRVVGAIALGCEPDLLIADEATTALDSTIQLQYLDLIKERQRIDGLSVVVITHDFGVVARICDRVAVMYAGKVVEEAPVETLFSGPRHPYTKALLNAVPKLNTDLSRLEAIEGVPPRLWSPPVGCSFAPRCAGSVVECTTRPPVPVAIGDHHSVACWRVAS